MEDSALRKISKEDLNKLPAEQFTGRIVVVQTPADLRKAIAFLADQPMVGFDTETRPNFRKGDNHLVSLIQLATESICFLIRINRLGIDPLLKDFLESETTLKIGLSTKDDFHGLNKITPIAPKGFVELQSLVKSHGIGEAGLSKIYALLFGKRISKRQQLTNWEAIELTAAQRHYAALDAWACLQIHKKITSPQ